MVAIKYSILALLPEGSTDIESILIIGAGPIVIGQACEFDYSGAQAGLIKRLDTKGDYVDYNGQKVLGIEETFL